MHPYSTWFVTPSSILNLLRSSNLRSLIKIFVIWTWDFINFNYTSFFIVHYIIKWHHVSMCLVWSWKTLFFDNKINDFLIHTIVINLSLYLCTSPFVFFLSLYTHLTPIIIFPFGRDLSSHVSFFLITFISSSTAVFHLWSWIAFSKRIGSQF